jgi:hypothetical protein
MIATTSSPARVIRNTPRQFECTRLITAEQVIATIKRIRGFSSGRCRAAET